MPVLDGKTIGEEEFEDLDDSVKREFEERSQLVQEQIFQALAEIKLIEKEAEKKIDEWQSNIALMTKATMNTKIMVAITFPTPILEMSFIASGMFNASPKLSVFANLAFAM